MPDEEPSAAERAMRAANELKGFEIDISKYEEDDLHKIVSLISVYQSAREKILRNIRDRLP